MKRCVIITAGPIGEYEPLKKLIDRENDYIISVDGGCDHLIGLETKADIVIGDLDSVDKLPEDIEVFKFKCEKDETDTMLAIIRGLQMGYKEFLIIGGLKGRLDHTFANLQALAYISSHGANGRIIDSDNEAYFLKDGELSFEPRDDYYISVFSFSSQAIGVTEKNMKYKLDNYDMNNSYPIGVSNDFLKEKAVISVKKGSLLIILSKKK